MPATHYITWLTVCRVSRHACHSLYPMAYRVQGFPPCLPLIVSHSLPCAGFPVTSFTHCIPRLTVCRVSRHAVHSVYPMAYHLQGYPSLTVSRLPLVTFYCWVSWPLVVLHSLTCSGFPSWFLLMISHGWPCAWFLVVRYTHCISWLTICRVSRRMLHSLYLMAYRVQGLPPYFPLIVSYDLPYARSNAVIFTHCFPWLTVHRFSCDFHSLCPMTDRHAFHSLYPIAYRVPSNLLYKSHQMKCQNFNVSRLVWQL